jgi:protein-tyrosine-phosphatase
MVKRVTDQAKNICEEALFAITGEYKQDVRHSILFIDEDGTCLAPMAEALAHKMFPNSAYYSCASRTTGSDLNPAMVKFMDQRGFDMDSINCEQLDPGSNYIGDYFVVVSLQGAVKSYIPHLPFHTSALEWDLGSSPSDLQGDEADSRVEELYREIVVNVRDLVETVTGKEAS